MSKGGWTKNSKNLSIAKIHSFILHISNQKDQIENTAYYVYLQTSGCCCKFAISYCNLSLYGLSLHSQRFTAERSTTGATNSKASGLYILDEKIN